MVSNINQVTNNTKISTKCLKNSLQFIICDPLLNVAFTNGVSTFRLPRARFIKYIFV